jgi:hypothetical protein
MSVTLLLNVVDIVGVTAFVVFFGMTFCVISLVERDIIVLPMWKRKVQPKDEHPLQGIWDSIPSDPPQGGNVIAPSTQNGNDYGFPLRYRSPVVPAPRVDRRLIGLDQR